LLFVYVVCKQGKLGFKVSLFGKKFYGLWFYWFLLGFKVFIAYNNCVLFMFFYLCFFYNIQLLIKGIGKLIQYKQEQHVVEFGKVLVVSFNIFLDPRYHWIKVGSNEVTFRSPLTGLGKVIKKFEMLSIEEEWWMLTQVICQPNFPSSLNIKFGYFNYLNFFIKGCFELYNVDFEELEFKVITY
jgi:hypothetical protein